MPLKNVQCRNCGNVQEDLVGLNGELLGYQCESCGHTKGESIFSPPTNFLTSKCGECECGCGSPHQGFAVDVFGVQARTSDGKLHDLGNFGIVQKATSKKGEGKEPTLH